MGEIFKKRPNLIFVCYRRDDAPGYAGHVFGDLSSERRFKERVFIDRGGIHGGADYRNVLGREIRECVVFLVLIGRDWLRMTDSKGQRRLGAPNDVLSWEVVTALDKGSMVIPVLVNGATMPEPEDLPAGMERLADKQAHALTDDHWDDDMKLLVRLLNEAIRRRPARRFRLWLGREWEHVKRSWRRWLREALRAAPFVIPTLFVPCAVIIGVWTYWVASRFRAAGSLDSVLDDPYVYTQLAALQALCVLVYAAIWLAAYRRLRRRRDAATAAGAAAQVQDQPRTE